MLSRVLLTASLFICIASCAAPRPTRQAIETRLAVDGSATFAGDVDKVRAATTAALRKLGHEVEESELRTKPRSERVGRWRWAKVTNPGATSAATVGAALSQGIVPSSEAEPQGTPSDTEISVSYRFELVGGDDGASTVVVVAPHATLEGSDVTDEYLAVIGSDAARRKFDEIFDAIRAEVSTAATVETAAGVDAAPSPAAQ